MIVQAVPSLAGLRRDLQSSLVPAAAMLAVVLAVAAATQAGPYPMAAVALALGAGLAAALALSLRATAALRTQARQLADLGAAARLGLWRQPAGSATAAWSPDLRRLMGVDLARPSEADLLALLHPDDRDRLCSLTRRVAVGLRPEGIDLRLARPGAVSHVRWDVLAETDRQGRLLALWGYAQDITDRHAAEDRARRASRMDALGQMAAGLAHDFNNLLCSVVLNVDMMAEAGLRAHAPRIVELAGRARGSAERGAALTGQLLAFAGKSAPRLGRIDLPQAVRACLAALPPVPGVALTLACDADPAAPLLVLADQYQLHAAVLALLDHARDAAGQLTRRVGGTSAVQVSVATTRLDRAHALALEVRPGPYALFTVQDATQTHPGHLPHLVEPFWRAVADGGDPNGSGVGLALAHGVARSHGGCLTLETCDGHGPGSAGMTARLLLPLAEPEHAGAHDAAESVAGRLAGLRVLLVEDDAEVRECTEALLRDDGALVTSTEDGAKALALLHGSDGFDLLLSDVVLPGCLSGIDVVEAACGLRPGLHALLASGYAAPAQELGRALPRGVALLAKPFRRAELLCAIAATLGPLSAA